MCSLRSHRSAKAVQKEVSGRILVAKSAKNVVGRTFAVRGRHYGPLCQVATRTYNLSALARQAAIEAKSLRKPRNEKSENPRNEKSEKTAGPVTNRESRRRLSERTGRSPNRTPPQITSRLWLVQLDRRGARRNCV